MPKFENFYYNKFCFFFYLPEKLKLPFKLGVLKMFIS